ncbi:hypothetical protein A9Q84_07685 [Halobacteriovorax marinus]|uniref:Uncharacterized protein n=1 Tax=Halobacteriovorax marinus TaxID=97084 RepID=A0A1Y5FBJ2_9BACT|nr:hypothetical protein A9Q84_07685 [Halobacteriovorax marinus]
MKTESGVTHYASRNDYIQSRNTPKASELVKKSIADSSKGLEDKVQLSDEAKAKSQLASEKSGLKETVKGNLKQNKTELKKASKHLLSDAVSVAKNAFNMPGLGTAVDLASKLLPSNTPAQEVKEILSIKESPGESIGPKIIFVSGLHLAGISSDNEGLSAMAGEVDNAQHFSWKDEESILKEINRTPKNEPLVLVGHSLGGDAIVNISNKLNSFANGFRKVDLLVTLDSVGFDNDIIPKNVKKNLNYIGNKDAFFNDGPNIARNNSKTDVLNFLRSESHTEMDDSNDIQEAIFNEIDSILEAKKKENNESQMMKSFLKKMMTEMSSEDILK